jgi:hypothetical protein
VSQPQAPAGWYATEADGEERYWDGGQWTSQHRPAAPIALAAGWYEEVDWAGRERFWDGIDWTSTYRERPGVAKGAERTNGSQPAQALPARLPTPTLLLAAGAVLLVVGSLLPWVTIASIFSVNGVTAKYGIGTLIAGLVAFVAAFGAGRIFSNAARRPVMISTAVLGLLSLLLAVGVTVKLRETIAHSSGHSTDTAALTSADPGTDPTLGGEFGQALTKATQSLTEALKPKTGFGVFVIGLGGILTLAGAAAELRKKP